MTIKEIFDSMAYGPAPESATEALAWIAKHNGTFGHFIDGAFTKPGETFTTAQPRHRQTPRRKSPKAPPTTSPQPSQPPAAPNRNGPPSPPTNARNTSTPSPA